MMSYCVWLKADQVSFPGLYLLYRADDEELSHGNRLCLIEVLLSGEGPCVRWGDGSLQKLIHLDEACRFLGPVPKKVGNE